MKKYDHKKIEKKWQKFWLEKKTFFSKNKTEGKKKFVLVEFPYPSGAGLHMGHMRPFIAGDVVSKYWKLKGFNTMYPIGWDAFGLPAENYAINNKVHPKISTAKNIANAKKQLLSWGTGFDWSREVNTTDPEYYKWTQWLFLQFLKKGLAYEATGLINWCPKDKTGLANEEVVDGKCDRCGSEVEKKELRQWYLKIINYAEKLLDGLKELPEWPEAVKLQQENWIGRSEGAEIGFRLQVAENQTTDEEIKVFTTRPDTLFGVTYLVLAPEHEKISNLKYQISNWDEVQKYIDLVKNKADIDRTAVGKGKTGVEIKGIYALNPATNEKIPVWIADYVLATYGTGAVMAVPAHDERDFEFAKKYNLPIKYVIAEEKIHTDGVLAFRKSEPVIKRNVARSVVKHWKDDKYLILDWKDYGWRTFVSGGIEEGEDVVESAKREIEEETGYSNINFKEFIGSPFKVKFFAPHKNQNREDIQQGLYFELKGEDQKNIDENETSKHSIEWIDGLKVKELVRNGIVDSILWERLISENFVSTGEGILINSEKFSGKKSSVIKKEITESVGGKWVTRYKLRDWVFSRQRYWGEPIPVIHCGKCGIVPVPDRELPVKLPEVKNYEPTGTGESPLAAIEKWVNTKCPTCKGNAKRETNTMPQWAGSSWYWLRYCDPRNKKTFVDTKALSYWTPVDLYFGGMEHTTLHLLYSRFWNLFLRDEGLVSAKEPYVKRIPHGIVLGPDGEKMSKSKGNVVNPDELVEVFGADTTRMYMMFLGPHGAQVAWNKEGIVGPRKFLERVWNMKEFISKKENILISRVINKTIKKVGEDIENFDFNTAISSMMIFVNHVYEQKQISKKSFLDFLKILSPFAPHICEELWNLLGNSASLYNSAWPRFDSKTFDTEDVKIVIQVNGKVRDTIETKRNLPEESLKKAVLSMDNIKKYTENMEILKVIVLPNRLINIVVKPQ